MMWYFSDFLMHSVAGFKSDLFKMGVSLSFFVVAVHSSYMYVQLSILRVSSHKRVRKSLLAAVTLYLFRSIRWIWKKQLLSEGTCGSPDTDTQLLHLFYSMYQRFIVLIQEMNTSYQYAVYFLFWGNIKDFENCHQTKMVDPLSFLLLCYIHVLMLSSVLLLSSISFDLHFAHSLHFPSYPTFIRSAPFYMR